MFNNFRTLNGRKKRENGIKKFKYIMQMMDRSENNYVYKSHARLYIHFSWAEIRDAVYFSSSGNSGIGTYSGEYIIWIKCHNMIKPIAFFKIHISAHILCTSSSSRTKLKLKFFHSKRHLLYFGHFICIHYIDTSEGTLK